MTQPSETHSLSGLRIRDPYILADPEAQTYYLCASLHPSEDSLDRICRSARG